MNPRGISRREAREVAVLFEEAAADLHGHALVVTQGRREAADDLVQEAFEAAVCAWAKLGEWDRTRQRRWLFTVVRNKAVDRWRMDRRVLLIADPQEPAPSPSLDVTFEQVACSLDAEQCWKVLQHMPPGRYRVAVLAWYFKWTSTEIAEHFDLTPSTVRVHLSRARRELRDALGPGGTNGKEDRD